MKHTHNHNHTTQAPAPAAEQPSEPAPAAAPEPTLTADEVDGFNNAHTEAAATKVQASFRGYQVSTHVKQRGWE